MRLAILFVLLLAITIVTAQSPPRDRTPTRSAGTGAIRVSARTTRPYSGELIAYRLPN